MNRNPYADGFTKNIEPVMFNCRYWKVWKHNKQEYFSKSIAGKESFGLPVTLDNISFTMIYVASIDLHGKKERRIRKEQNSTLRFVKQEPMSLLAKQQT